MKTIKVIDLLSKIANGEEVPKKIRISFYDEGTPEIYNFTYNKDIEQYEDDEGFLLDSVLNILLILNKEVEIIEEDKKIETIDPIDYCHSTDTSKDMVLVDKINEIIKYINKEEK